LTFVIDVPTNEGLKNARGEGVYDRMEAKGFEFHNKVKEGFLRIAEENKDRCVIIPYSHGGINEMNDSMYGILNERLEDKIRKS